MRGAHGGVAHGGCYEAPAVAQRRGVRTFSLKPVVLVHIVVAIARVKLRCALRQEPTC